MDKLHTNDLSTPRHTGVGDSSDIKSRLYSLFEEKGLVDKIRAHIREQMVMALKDSPAWSNMNRRNVTSPMVQAINLLVADFLMNQDNLFTLSVFFTEVPLLSNLHEFSSYVNRAGGITPNKSNSKPKFTSDDVQSIVEALNIKSNSDIMELTNKYYFSDNENQVFSLLACLFKAITNERDNLSKNDDIQNNENDLNIATQIDNETYEYSLNNWLINIEDILSSFNLNEGQRNNLKKLFIKYHQNNNVQEAALYKEHLKKLEIQKKEMLKTIENLEQILSTHFHSYDTSLLFEREQQLRSEQQQLYQLITIFEEREKFVQEKLLRLQEWEKKLQDVENKKYELQIKEMEILNREKLLKEKSMEHMNKTKNIESKQVKVLQEQNIDLAKQLQEIKLKLDECEKYNKVDGNIHLLQSSLENEIVRKLQKENDELREFIVVQRERIEELTNRVSNYAKQIKKSRQVPLVSANFPSRNVKKKLHFIDDLSKKNLHTNQNISSTTTDLSTTVLESDNLTEDDMVREARSRLKKLEINTAKVEENLKHFQTNHMNNSINHNVMKVNRKSYNNIRTHFSDDSDYCLLESNSNRVNLKELANKIGYHRTIRRSRNTSPSENDTSPDIMRNKKYQDYTNISPIKIVSSNINNMYRESFVNKPNSRIESSFDTLNYPTEQFTNRSTQLSEKKRIQIKLSDVNKQNKSINSPRSTDSEKQIKTKTVDNNEMRHNINQSKLSDNNKNSVENYNTQNNGNVILQSVDHTEVIDLPQKPKTVVQQCNSIGVNTSSISKNEQETDHTISFGSNKTDKSSDFWA